MSLYSDHDCGCNSPFCKRCDLEYVHARHGGWHSDDNNNRLAPRREPTAEQELWFGDRSEEKPQ